LSEETEGERWGEGRRRAQKGRELRLLALSLNLIGLCWRWDWWFCPNEGWEVEHRGGWSEGWMEMRRIGGWGGCTRREQERKSSTSVAV